MIDILLASYNGEKYIDTQISSIVNQTYKEWKLCIHDDGSSDLTVAIIKKWCEIDSRIQFIDDGINFHDPGKHFMHLLAFSHSELICFADQDDYWLEYKLEEMISDFPIKNKTPLLLVSHGYLWDTNKKDITPTIDFYQAYNLEQFLFLNGGLQGCAMMFNSKIRDIAIAHDFEKLFMHDHIISLIAFTFGSVRYIEKKIFLYRQHKNNVTVHQPKNMKQYIEKIIKNSTIPVIYIPIYETVEHFYETFKSEISKEKKQIFQKYLTLPSIGTIRRFFNLLFSKFSLGYKGHAKLLAKVLVRPFFSNKKETI